MSPFFSACKLYKGNKFSVYSLVSVKTRYLKGFVRICAQTIVQLRFWTSLLLVSRQVALHPQANTVRPLLTTVFSSETPFSWYWYIIILIDIDILFDIEEKQTQNYYELSL